MPSPDPRAVERLQRYVVALHALQSGVKAVHELDILDVAQGRRKEWEEGETSVKHLRVGVNSAKLEQGALVKLLIEAGIITSEAYETAIVEALEEEVRQYEADLSKRTGAKVTLG
jgi:hypothetical protein